jgi:hypothetical protein
MEGAKLNVTTLQEILAGRFVVAFCLLALFALSAAAQIGGTGWTPLTVNFKIQSPTNALESARYFFTNNIFHCLVFSNDGAFSVGNTTAPRTEQRFNPDYTNGEIQYQATLLAPSNENSYCVFQIHTGDAESDAHGSTTFMAFWFTNYNGSVHDYSGATLATNLGNQWFQLNVDHNLVTQTIRVWINRQLVWTQSDNGAGDFYFKDGVYEQGHGPTLQMDTYITNTIREWVNSGTNPPAAPAGLAAVPTATQIPLTWNASVGATNYNLKRSTTDGGPYTVLAKLAGTNYTDSTTVGGTTYYYVVSALDQFGESSNSTPIATSLISTAPPAPPIFGRVTSSGTNLIFNGGGGVTNGNYCVLASTNLALPLGRWPRIATNSFSASGGFNFTNSPAPGAPQTFYQLQLQ